MTKQNVRLKLQYPRQTQAAAAETRRLSWLLAILCVLVRLLGLQRTSQLVVRLPGPAANPADKAQQLARAEYWRQVVETAAGRSTLSAECAEKSLAIYYLLKKEGIAGQLKLGHQGAPGHLQGHMWLEVHGQVVSEPGDPSALFPVLQHCVNP